MFKLCLFLCVGSILQVSRACDDGNDEHLTAARQQESIDYLTNAYGLAPYPWGSPYYYQPSRVPGMISIWVELMVYRAAVIYGILFYVDYTNVYEGRTPLNRHQPSINPFVNYYKKSESIIQLICFEY